MIFVQTLRHLFRGEIHETDVWIGPYMRWVDWPECHGEEWQPLWYGDLVIAVRPVSDCPGVGPVARGVQRHPRQPGRFRVRHEMGPQWAETELIVRPSGTREPPSAAGAPTWHRIGFGALDLFVCPVLPRPVRHGDEPDPVRRHVGPVA